MKKSVDIKALAYAIEDGRIDVWENTNGYICIMNNRSKRIITVASMHDMEYDPYGNPEDVPEELREVILIEEKT